MTTRMFNGSTLTFGTAVARLVGISYRCGGATIDVSEPADLNKLYEAGQDDLELTARVKRMPTLARKAKNTITIVWANGDSTTCPGTWQVMDVSGGGDYDGPITGSITFKPTVPDA